MKNRPRARTVGKRPAGEDGTWAATAQRQRPGFAISTFTAWYGRYIPVRQVADTRTARYRAVLSKIDRQQSISAVGSRLREIELIEGEKGKKKRKRIKRKEEENLVPVLSRAASSPSPVVRPRVVARAHHRSHPREEMEHLPARGERSKRRRPGINNTSVRTDKSNLDKDITNLQAYAMVSQDPIDAKFDALESRLESRVESCLEDKLRALFTDFKIGQPPSPTKIQRGESSERPQRRRDNPRTRFSHA
ncbi:hypothetical protein GW17_00034383 [Ensete ventricosum]|nr:hypothetical protein GW17_00034383 [Ensete ventricosum]